MTGGGLVLAFIRRRPASFAFHVIILAVAVSLVAGVLQLREATATRLARDIAGVDLVVGAKGSGLQLMMSSVLHVDIPNGNIAFEAAERLGRDPLVASAAPVSLGDSINGVRIVGATRAYPALYGADIAVGDWWSAPGEAVLGATAAAALGFGAGDTFQGEHGLSGGEAHGEPYRVVGVLARTGTVLDRVVLTDLESVWRVHEASDDHAGDEGPHHSVDPSREVTAILIKYRSPMGAVVLPARINEEPDLTMASPAREAQRLNAMTGVGAEALNHLGALLLLLAGIGFVVAISSALVARRRDLAVLRALGASPMRLWRLILAEGGALGILGGLIGVILARLSFFYVAHRTPSFDLPMPGVGLLDAVMILGAGALGAVAAAAPGLFAVHADPASPLSEARA